MMLKQNNKKIVVNASALRSGGALSILQQFIKEVPDDDIEYLVFVNKSVKLNYSQKNIQIVQVNVISFVKRFLWDAIGLNKWLRKHKICSLASISLQNTNFRLSAPCANFIYYHQSIPIYQNNWSLFRKDERSLWFYKNIYPFFVNLFINSETRVFVQLEYLKNGFANKYKFNKDNIHVVLPNIETCFNQKELDIDIDGDNINLFYPAAAYVYKNHQVLFDALSFIDGQVNKKVVLYLTTAKDELKIKENYKNVQIVLLNKIAHEEVIWLYHQVDALLFPSYVETLGLPLIEAASFGLPVIASDLPYSREVLSGYEGVTYIDCKDSNSWGNAILKLGLVKGKRFESFRKENTNSWKYFFEIIKRSL